MFLRQCAAAVAAVSLLVSTAAQPQPTALVNTQPCTTGMHKEGNEVDGIVSYWVTLVIGPVHVHAMIDTGFFGFISLPRATLAQLYANGVTQIEYGPKLVTTLADGHAVEQDTAHIPDVGLLHCDIWSYLPVIITDNGVPLIGAALLSDYSPATFDFEHRRLFLKQP